MSKEFEQLDELGLFKWLREERILNFFCCRNVTAEFLDNLSISDIHRTVINACAFRWFREKHNLYGIIIPTVTMNWTFKTMTAVIGMVEVPPYSHVDAYDYSSREEAEFECLKKLIELVKNK